MAKNCKNNFFYYKYNTNHYKKNCQKRVKRKYYAVYTKKKYKSWIKIYSIWKKFKKNSTKFIKINYIDFSTRRRDFIIKFSYRLRIRKLFSDPNI